MKNVSSKLAIGNVDSWTVLMHISTNDSNLLICSSNYNKRPEDSTISGSMSNCDHYSTVSLSNIIRLVYIYKYTQHKIYIFFPYK